MSNTVWVMLIIILELVGVVCANLLLNGGFSAPGISYNSWLANTATSWAGNNYQLYSDKYNLGYGQYVDLQSRTNLNGYIMQSVNLSGAGNCTLQFYQKAYTSSFNSYVVQVYWNGVLQTTKKANTTAPTLQTLTLTGINGTNTIKFNEIGTTSDGIGMFIDEVSLACTISTPNTTNTTNNNSTNATINSTTTTNTTYMITNTTNTTNMNNAINTTNTPTNSTGTDNLRDVTNNAETAMNESASFAPQSQGLLFNEQQSQIASLLISLPFRQVASLRCIYVLIDDLWLYYYDQRNYQGILQIVFKTITFVQLLKFEVMEKYLGWAKSKQSLPLSDYTPYTMHEFVTIEGSSSVLIDSNYPFFVYTIPQNILTCLLFLGIFRFFRKYASSKHLRKFLYFKSVLAQLLIQGNLAYFVFVCFSHLGNSFFFKFVDKVSLLFTTCFFFGLTAFSLSFYPLMNRYLKKEASHFINCIYRFGPGFYFITMKTLVRSFLCGCLHYFFHNYYDTQIIFLCILEVLIITLSIYLDSTFEIFISKSVYCTTLVYHGLFFWLNLSLYIQYRILFEGEAASAISEIILSTQEVIVYSLFGITVILMILDLIPLGWIKRKFFLQKLHEYFDKRGQKKKSKKAKRATSARKTLKKKDNNNIFVGKKVTQKKNSRFKEDQKIQPEKTIYGIKTTYKMKNNFKIKKDRKQKSPLEVKFKTYKWEQNLQLVETKKKKYEPNMTRKFMLKMRRFRFIDIIYQLVLLYFFNPRPLVRRTLLDTRRM